MRNLPHDFDVYILRIYLNTKITKLEFPIILPIIVYRVVIRKIIAKVRDVVRFSNLGVLAVMWWA